MALTDAQRLALRNSLADRLDADTADLLMEALPPMDHHQLATKTDIAASEAVLRRELAMGLTAVGTRIDGLDARVDSLGARLDERIDGLSTRIDEQGTRLGARIDGLSARLDDFGREQRQLIFGAVGVILTALIALAGLILGFG